MKRILTVFILMLLVGGLVVTIGAGVGLPTRALRSPEGFLIGAINAHATDTLRIDLFSGSAPRIVPFQMLYPAGMPGVPAVYVPNAEPVINALADSHGWIFRILLGRIGTLAAPWTDAAEPAAGGPFPVVISSPGVTGYMQMNSYQTTALAAQGFVVVTLNQPGAVAAAVMPDHQIVRGLTRENAVSLIAPSYMATDQDLPGDFGRKLAPEQSIVLYFAADVSLVLDQLVEINTETGHLLHGLLDLDRVGVMECRWEPSSRRRPAPRTTASTHAW